MTSSHKMLDKIVSVAVYPGIGLARVGNSPEYYIGPEAPDVIADPGGEGGPGPEGGWFKDKQGRLKPQAARFRVFGLDAEGNAVAELNCDNAEIEWTVHVRNMKAANYAFRGRYFFDPSLKRNPNIQGDEAPTERDQLIVDPGARTISGREHGPVPLDGGSIYTGLDGQKLSLPRDLPFSSPPEPDPDDPERVLVEYRSATVELGRLETDALGNLVFVPGVGKSESCTSPQVCIHEGRATTSPYTGQYSYFNVPGWYDDTCGGSIEAKVRFKTACGEERELSTGGDPLRRGWVAVAPPKYSPWTYNVVSLLDLQINLFPALDPAGDQTDPSNPVEVDFYRDIYPVLQTVSHYGWTSDMAFVPHGPHHTPGDFLTGPVLTKIADPSSKDGEVLRWQIYDILRHPEDDPVPPPPLPAPIPAVRSEQPQESWRMPKLWGSGGEPQQNQRLGTHTPNEFLSLTKQQLARFEKWAKGKFVTGTPPGPPKPYDDYDIADRPMALNFAALQPTVGGGFHPGIEITYISTFPEWFAGPFRVAGEVEGLTIEPGQVNGFMAMPWQGDFWSCNTMWWPAQRPEIVVEVDDNGRRIAIPWFRGKGIPADASTQDGYMEGYNIMVHIWYKLGIIAQASAASKEWGGETQLAEFERDASLDQNLGIPPGSCVPPGWDGDVDVDA